MTSTQIRLQHSRIQRRLSSQHPRSFKDRLSPSSSFSDKSLLRTTRVRGLLLPSLVGGRLVSHVSIIPSPEGSSSVGSPSPSCPPTPKSHQPHASGPRQQNAITWQPRYNYQHIKSSLGRVKPRSCNLTNLDIDSLARAE